MGKAKTRETGKQTTPKGTEIPVPKRGEFFRDLEKVVMPKRHDAERDRPKD
jgi:hypothetical protein